MKKLRNLCVFVFASFVMLGCTEKVNEDLQNRSNNADQLDMEKVKQTRENQWKE